MTRNLRLNRFLVLLVILQAAVLIPFRFTHELGERDSYRMFLGLVDTVKSGAHFNSSLLYNREASFGYYGLLYALVPIVGHTPSALMSAMNWIGLLSVILFTIPCYVVTERMFGKRVAIASGAVLIATPVWWHCGLYAHPTSTSLLLFFTGLAILCRHVQSPSLAVRVSVLSLFALALMFRFDVVLLFISLGALLFHVRQVKFSEIAKEAGFYVAGSIALFSTAKSFLPRTTLGNAPPSIMDLLARFEHTSHMLGSIRDSTISLGQGFSFILLLCFPASALLLFRNKQYSLLLFVSGEILANLLFWLPNSSPPRHYLFMVPAMSISAVLCFLKADLPISAGRHRSLRAFLVGSAVASSVVLTSFALNYGKGYLSYFPSQFSDRVLMKAKIAQANHVADELARLPRLSTPVIVLCDSTLVLAKMEQRASDTSALYRMVTAGARSIGLHDVHQGKNRFVMIEQSWEETEVQGFDDSGEYANLPVLSAPYLSIEYKGLRARVRDLQIIAP